MHQKLKTVLTMVLIATLSVAITYAVVKVTWDIPTAIHVSACYEVEVTTEDGVTKVVSLNIAELPPGENYTAHFRIFNTGNTKIWVKWSAADFPTGFNIELYHIVKDVTDYYDPWIENTEFLPIEAYGELPTSLIDFTSPQEGLDSVKMVLTNVNALAGDYSFTLTFSGCDSSTG